MTDLMSWPAVAALASLAGFGIAFATFWITFGSRIGRAELEASEAKSKAKDADDKATLLSAAFAMYREQVARDYIHRETMREMEDRLAAAIDRLGDRLDRFVETAARK